MATVTKNPIRRPRPHEAEVAMRVRNGEAVQTTRPRPARDDASRERVSILEQIHKRPRPNAPTEDDYLSEAISALTNLRDLRRAKADFAVFAEGCDKAEREMFLGEGGDEPLYTVERGYLPTGEACKQLGNDKMAKADIIKPAEGVSAERALEAYKRDRLRAGEGAANG